jgi:hypothetical protein
MPANAENTLPFVSKADSNSPEKSNPPSNANLEKLLLGLVPFTPVQFTGSDSLIAWGRLAGYGLLAYATYNKIRPVAYIALGAAGISLATSLTAKMWSKK